jgi:outer membrane protein OmpA-like peptidoglycan-associated protein
MKRWKWIFFTALLISGCATNPDGSSEVKRTGYGALIGSAVGAGTGALFGGNRGVNALIGAAAGGAAGAGIGNYMDRQAATLKKQMPQARVERQGDKVLVVLPSGILFDKGKDALRPEAMESLTKAAPVLRDSKTSIIIEGHTDSSGGDAINRPLSQRRADRVREYLTAQGVPPQKMVAIGFGSSRPAYPEDSERNRNLNRRVQLEITPDLSLREGQQQQPVNP